MRFVAWSRHCRVTSRYAPSPRPPQRSPRVHAAGGSPSPYAASARHGQEAPAFTRREVHLQPRDRPRFSPLKPLKVQPAKNLSVERRFRFQATILTPKVVFLAAHAKMLRLRWTPLPTFLSRSFSMKRTALALLATGLAATWIGCQSATDSEPAADLVLVTLDVPTMV